MADKALGKMRDELVKNPTLTHKRTEEYASYIMDAIVTNKPFKIGGNVLNTGRLIENLPDDACVEIPCMVDGMGINPCRVGRLPVQLAAMNMTNINVHMITIEAAVTRKKSISTMPPCLIPIQDPSCLSMKLSIWWMT